MNPLKNILSDRTSLGKLRSKVCPKCKIEYTGYPAISRVDDITEICSDCGTAEALEDWAKSLKKR